LSNIGKYKDIKERKVAKFAKLAKSVLMFDFLVDTVSGFLNPLKGYQFG
jgi:hypothetical protein